MNKIFECQTCGYQSNTMRECPQCNEMHGGLVEMKPAALFCWWDGSEWKYEIRAGEKGTGKVVAKASAWDNEEARGNAHEIACNVAQRKGYAVVA